MSLKEFPGSKEYGNFSDVIEIGININTRQVKMDSYWLIAGNYGKALMQIPNLKGMLNKGSIELVHRK